MHQHHATIRLLFRIVVLVLIGIAVYVVLAYGIPALHEGPEPVATSTPSTTVTTSVATTTSSLSTATSTGTSGDTNWEQGMTVVTAQGLDKTVTLSKNERFVIQLGSTLNWTLVFSPTGNITRVPNSTTANGVQGVYEADVVGTTTLEATGAPICKAGEACPQFRQLVTVTFVVK